MPGFVRSRHMKMEMPSGTERWKIAYLMDTIFTRDTWMHRGDIARATGRELVLTPDHDGRIVADVVAEWARAPRPARSVWCSTARRAARSCKGDDGERARNSTPSSSAASFPGAEIGEGLLAQEVPF